MENIAVMFFIKITFNVLHMQLFRYFFNLGLLSVLYSGLNETKTHICITFLCANNIAWQMCSTNVFKTMYTCNNINIISQLN